MIAEFHFCFEGCGAFGQMLSCPNCDVHICIGCFSPHLQGEAQATIDEAFDAQRRVYAAAQEETTSIPIHSQYGTLGRLAVDGVLEGGSNVYGGPEAFSDAE